MYDCGRYALIEHHTGSLKELRSDGRVGPRTNVLDETTQKWASFSLLSSREAMDDKVVQCYNVLPTPEKEQIQRRLQSALRERAYTHRWRRGDIIVTDNLAVCHRAAKAELVSGLRVLHRVTVMGTHDLKPV